MQSCFALNIENILYVGICYPYNRSVSKALPGNFQRENDTSFYNKLLDIDSKGNKIFFPSETLFDEIFKSCSFKDLLESDHYSFKVLLYTRNLFEHAFFLPMGSTNFLDLLDVYTFPIIYPPTATVNGSLTFLETEIQRVLIS